MTQPSEVQGADTIDAGKPTGKPRLVVREGKPTAGDEGAPATAKAATAPAPAGLASLRLQNLHAFATLAPYHGHLARSVSQASLGPDH